MEKKSVKEPNSKAIHSGQEIPAMYVVGAQFRIKIP